MTWQSLRIEAGEDKAELLSDALMELGALSVSIEDADAETEAEQAIFGEPGTPPPGLWRHNVVSALFDATASPQQVVRELEDATGLGPLRYAVESVEEQDWVRLTQSQFDPIRIRDHLWIVPSWHTAPQQNAINIVLDPGLAFGTGSHPTTHLCLGWLADHLQNGENVLDYGCGSGILAIAAKKLGAGLTVGIDIDPLAIEASGNNALQNQVEVEFALADQAVTSKFDVVVANILTSPLKMLAPVLAESCRQGGRIALSGILREQADEVLTIYGQWFDMQPPQHMENWALLTGSRK